MRILEANKAFNLVSRRSPEAQIRDNALDGLILGCALHRVSRETGKLLLLDAGSGSGVPGVPAMFVIETFVPQSQHRLLMIDSHRMKQEFLCDLIDLFDSGKAQVFRGRLENPVLSGLCKEFGPDHHWILSSKALARLDKTLKWIRNLGPDLDELLLVKGPAVLDEIDKGLIEKEGLELRGLYRFNSSLRNTYLLRLTRR